MLLLFLVMSEIFSSAKLYFDLLVILGNGTFVRNPRIYEVETGEF